jgi:hypothetical protein
MYHQHFQINFPKLAIGWKPSLNNVSKEVGGRSQVYQNKGCLLVPIGFTLVVLGPSKYSLTTCAQVGPRSHQDN